MPEPPDLRRRLRRVEFDGDAEYPKWALLGILAHLPEDAAIVSSDCDSGRKQHSWTFRSSQFPAVRDGGLIPRMQFAFNVPERRVTPIPPPD